MYPTVRQARPVFFCLIFIALWSIGTARSGAAPPQPGADVPVQESTPPVRTREQAAAWASWDALPTESRGKVDPRILAELAGAITPVHVQASSGYQPLPVPQAQPRERQHTRFLVHLQQQADLERIAQRRFASRADQRRAVFSALQATAQESQQPVKALLESRQGRAVASYQPLLIVNAIAVEADLSTVVALAQRRDVARIAANYPLFPVPYQPEEHPPIGTGITANWNTEQVQAQKVWQELNVRGEGAVVGSFDTGVNASHPALREQYRGNQGGTRQHDYNWFEPDPNLYPDGNLGSSLSAVPYDCAYSDHGTHTTGTMVGFDGSRGDGAIGMAPAAQWIAVPGICEDTMPGGIQDDIGGLKAFQWFLCPTDLTGDLATADCAKAPDAINNSWGTANPVDDTFEEALKALRTAGIAPVFAAGNPDAGDGSIGAPGNIPEAITVGATDYQDRITYFSAIGPSFYPGEQKPEFTAPGWFVLSAADGDRYSRKSGTSMAAPHVAGLIALLVSADLQDGFRDYNVDELEKVMAATAKDLGDPGPDPIYGYGRIDAYEAVRTVLRAGDLQGAVRNGSDGSPVPHVQIVATEKTTGNRFSAETAADGSYALTVSDGRYTLAFSAWGFQPLTFENQPVLAGAVSLADFALTPIPRHQVGGRVLNGGQPVAGVLVQVAANPRLQSVSDASGRYELKLPAGQHELRLTGEGFRQRSAVFDVDVTTVLEISLEPAPKILLVNGSASGGWFFGWPIRDIFDWALSQQGYLYDLWRVEDPTVQGTAPTPDGGVRQGVPSLEKLVQYDVVIWYHSACDGFSYDCDFGYPAAVNADDELIAYLEQGGYLILSGQDLGMGDGRDRLIDDYLEVDLLMRTAADTSTRIVGRDFLQGLDIGITNASVYGFANGVYSLRPDALEPSPGSSNAYSILEYDNGTGPAGLAVAPCDKPWKAVYLGMGFENIGPRGNQRQNQAADLLGRTVRWLDSPRQAYSFNTISQKFVQQGDFDSTVLHQLRLINTGTQPLTFQIQTSGAAWPTRVLEFGTPIPSQITLGGCESRQLQVAVKVPAQSKLGAQDRVELGIIPQDRPELTAFSQQYTTEAMPRWQEEPAPAVNRAGHGLAAFPGQNVFYIVGGEPLRTAFSSIWEETAENERYNACAREWQRLAPLPAARDALMVAGLNGQILAAGGETNNGLEFHREAFLYDPAADNWSQVAPLPEPIAAGFAAVIDGKFYLFGGYTPDRGARASTFVYDPGTNAWTENAPMPGGGRYFAAGAVLDEKVYIFGGIGHKNRLEIYDPATDTWNAGAQAARSRAYATLTAGPDGYLYLTGGSIDYDVALFTERYNPNTDQWEILDGLDSIVRYNAASTFVGGRLFQSGGRYGVPSHRSLKLGPSFCESTLNLAGNAVSYNGTVQVNVLLSGERTPVHNAQFVAPLPAHTQFAGFLQNEIGAIWNEQAQRVEWTGALPDETTRYSLGYQLRLTGEGISPGSVMTVTGFFDNGQGTQFQSARRVLITQADLSASSKSVSAPEVSGGSRVTYTIGIASATAVGAAAQVLDVLPAHVRLLPETLTASTGSAEYDATANAVRWAGDFSQALAGYANTTSDYIWGDSDGKGEFPGVQFEWHDVRSTETFLLQGITEVTCNVPIGFAFPFYGETVESVCVDTGGLLALNEWPFSHSFQTCPLPNEFLKNSIIAGVWDLLDVQGGVYAKTIGNAPNRAFVVQWHDVINRRLLSPREGLNFQIVLYESGKIRINILTAEGSSGYTSTTGLQHQDGQRGVTYACEVTDSLHDELSIKFVPPGGTTNQPTEQLSFAVEVAPDVPIDTQITNSAIITGPNGVYTRSASFAANPVDLATSEKRVTPAAVVVGQPVLYEITLRNTGLTTTTDTSLTDVLPLGVNYQPDSLNCSAGACQIEQRTVRWAGTVPPGRPVTVSFSADVHPSLANGTRVTNTAQLVSARSTPLDLSATFRARRSDLSASYFVLDPYFGTPGGEVTVNFYVRNHGVEPADVSAQLPLPDGLAYQTDSLFCGTGNCWMDGPTVHWNGLLRPRGLVPVRLRVRIPADVTPGQIFRSQAQLTDKTWNVNYRISLDVIVPHQVFGAAVSNGMKLLDRLFMPLIPNSQNASEISELP